MQVICYVSCLSCLNKGYGRSANHTFVDEVFGGELISTIVCKQCGQVGSWVGLLRVLTMPLGGSWVSLGSGEVLKEYLGSSSWPVKLVFRGF